MILHRIAVGPSWGILQHSKPKWWPYHLLFYFLNFDEKFMSLIVSKVVFQSSFVLIFDFLNWIASVWTLVTKYTASSELNSGTAYDIANRPHQTFFVKSHSELFFFGRASYCESIVCCGTVVVSWMEFEFVGAIFKQSDGNFGFCKWVLIMYLTLINYLLNSIWHKHSRLMNFYSFVNV